MADDRRPTRTAWWPAATLVLSLSLACQAPRMAAQDGATPSPGAATATATVAVGAVVAPTTQPPPAPPPTPQPTAAPGAAALQTEVIIRGLDTPWALAFAPDGRMFISERPGRIRVVKDGQLVEEPWMQLPVVEVSEAGQLGLALDPQFAENRFVYTAYTYRGANGRLTNRLVRLRDDPAAGPAGRGSLDGVLLDGVPGNNNHDGGRVSFGPDGKLYWSVGDAQSREQSQNPGSLAGKILRFNPDGSIPADNPSPGSPVYSFGHRNVQGLAWQPETGRLYATEHGPTGDAGRGCCRDEVNLVEPGVNYGWPVITGDERHDGMRSPIIHSGTSATWAPAGATFVTHGPWRGSFLFTGLASQGLFRLTLDPAEPHTVLNLEVLLQRQFGRLRDVVEGPDGALYLLTSNRDGRGNPAPDDDRIIRLIVS